MGTNLCYHSALIGAALTTRTLSVTTAAAQAVTLLSSGALLVNFQNLGGGGNITLGGSSMVMGSGDTLFTYANREFYPVADTFLTYVRADSAASNLAVTEYGVV